MGSLDYCEVGGQRGTDGRPLHNNLVTSYRSCGSSPGASGWPTADTRTPASWQAENERLAHLEHKRLVTVTIIAATRRFALAF